MIPQLATAIALLLAPYSPPTTPAPIGYPPGVAADVVARQIVSYVRYRDAEAIVALVVAEDAQKAAEAAQEAVEAIPVPSVPVASSGAHSDAWWHGVSGCEQSGLDNPTYGYFSIMDGSAAGKSWADQEAEANGIISRYGDSAWAASCVAAGYSVSPGG